MALLYRAIAGIGARHTTMTFAGVKPARRWVDVSFLASAPIDDPRIRVIQCFGPTSFSHTFRLDEAAQLDTTIEGWLCQAWHRGDQETLDPDAHVRPLTGGALELVVVPLRALVISHDQDLALKIPRYAAEVFARHPATTARIARTVGHGRVGPVDGTWLLSPRIPVLRELGLGIGDSVDAFIRADIAQRGAVTW